jgi:hypothetical protein
VLSENRGGFWNDCGTEHLSGVSDRFIARCEGIGGYANFPIIVELDLLH